MDTVVIDDRELKVRSRLHVARHRLRELLDEREEDQDRMGVSGGVAA